ncbi:transmembrane protein 243 [Parasteatoda tepidariorum]|uniref:transmembrane protein 243 n=1 Tax=Parasteatoda tepidariorum TaxID=114398 RepID=UPI00077F86FF|nr:transmembrane protein 243 [Parasteatoda tepidariorum]XP_015909286.1 transmembrane protein 243 [Parasteatoda tepidariorum]XP_015909287.1 transmembrane protein 243 [Parasteatoda tepidariorum]XP_015909290.1 transmembrane protein 243 [Parasteatoda tepidariorum]
MENPSEEYRPLFGSSVPDRPLFGDSNRRDRVVNMVLGIITTLLVLITMFSAFFAKTPPQGLNVYFILCIFLICLGHILLIYWYRQGDLDPKFRLLIYYNALTIILLTTCALSFFFTER